MVEKVVGVLAHSVEAFGGVRGKALVHFVSAEARVDSVGARPPEVLGSFAQDGFAVLLEIQKESGNSGSAIKVRNHADSSVGKDFFGAIVAGDFGDRARFIPGSLCLGRSLGKRVRGYSRGRAEATKGCGLERAQSLGEVRIGAYAHAKCIATPGLNADELVRIGEFDCARVLLLRIHL